MNLYQQMFWCFHNSWKENQKEPGSEMDGSPEQWHIRLYAVLNG